MRDREPEPWESGAPGPFLWIATAQGNMEMWALGEDRVLVGSPGRADRRRLRGGAADGGRTRWAARL